VTRWISIAMMALLMVAALSELSGAQPRPAQPTAPAAGSADGPGRGDAVAREDTAGQENFENSKTAAVFFWVIAILTIAGALFIITRRNLVAAVMGMVGTFFAIAALYAMLYAHFIAAIQVVVYAGAIMVLFVFVVMILNRPEDEPFVLSGLLGKGLAAISMAYLLFRLGQILWAVKDSAAARIAAPGATVEGFEFGSTKSIGSVLFGDYLFPFEAVSVVLLVAVVGALSIARPSKDPAASADAEAGS
jgi:NADH-quinone oxidoreductase subunit J